MVAFPDFKQRAAASAVTGVVTDATTRMKAPVLLSYSRISPVLQLPTGSG